MGQKGRGVVDVGEELKGGAVTNLAPSPQVGQGWDGGWTRVGQGWWGQARWGTVCGTELVGPEGHCGLEQP